MTDTIEDRLTNELINKLKNDEEKNYLPLQNLLAIIIATLLLPLLFIGIIIILLCVLLWSITIYIPYRAYKGYIKNE